jgi:TIR domain
MYGDMTMTSAAHPEIFVSYSRSDEHDMLTFRRHLRGMLHNAVDVRVDLNIRGGTEWEQELNQQMNAARSALVLATPDYLASDWWP